MLKFDIFLNRPILEFCCFKKNQLLFEGLITYK